MAICSFTGEEVIFCSDDVCLKWPIYRRGKKTPKKPQRLIHEMKRKCHSPNKMGGGEEFELIEFVLRDML